MATVFPSRGHHLQCPPGVLREVEPLAEGHRAAGRDAAGVVLRGIEVDEGMEATRMTRDTSILGI